MKLPVTFRSLGAPITIKEQEIPDALGSWDEATGVLSLKPGQSEMGKVIILLHEALHVVETMMIQNGTLSRRVNHGFITGAAFGLGTILMHAGAIQGVTREDWEAFVKEEDRPRKHRQNPTKTRRK
jgi:hypothetical protein